MLSLIPALTLMKYPLVEAATIPKGDCRGPQP